MTWINEMDQQQANQLFEMATTARELAYAPYSEFAVGAAILCNDQNVFLGCNVENGVFGLSICAERVAVCKAVSEGFHEFTAIAISASPAATPCGSCRQFLSEFSNEMVIIVGDASRESESGETILRQWKIGDLLPDKFSFRQIK